MARNRALAVVEEMGRCKHFTGIHNRACAVEVLYMPLRDVSQPGMARWPCLTIKGQAATTVCSKRELPTREEAEHAVDEREESIERFLAKLAAGVCAICSAEPEDWQQDGACIYAVPCGHRVGQGDAAEYKAGVLAERQKRATR